MTYEYYCIDISPEDDGEYLLEGTTRNNSMVRPKINGYDYCGCFGYSSEKNLFFNLLAKLWEYNTSSTYNFESDDIGVYFVYEKQRANTQWRCYDLKSKTYISNAGNSTNAQIQCPIISGYEYEGYVCNTSFNNCINSTTYNTAVTCEEHGYNQKNYIVFFYNKSEITITYNPNGGNGENQTQTEQSSTDIKIEAINPTRSNYIFKGWGKNSTAIKPDYKDIIEGGFANDITLYAIWWPDFNWNKKNYEEANQLNNYISTYIGITNNNELKTGDLYTLTWINNILSILKQTQLERTMLIKQEQMDNIVDKYKNYEET